MRHPSVLLRVLDLRGATEPPDAEGRRCCPGRDQRGLRRTEPATPLVLRLIPRSILSKLDANFDQLIVLADALLGAKGCEARSRKLPARPASDDGNEAGRLPERTLRGALGGVRKNVPRRRPAGSRRDFVCGHDARGRTQGRVASGTQNLEQGGGEPLHVMIWRRCKRRAIERVAGL